MEEMAVQIFLVALVSGLILLGAEIFVPGGLLGALGGLALLLAVGVGFFAFPEYGPHVALAIVFLLGISIYLWIKIFPTTRLGLDMTSRTDLSASKSAGEEGQRLKGKSGRAVSDLRPSGFCMIDGQRVDVVTYGEMIEKGQSVRVADVKGNRIVVEAEQELAAANELAQTSADKV